MLKDILVLSDGTAGDEARFAFAASLASEFEACFDVVLVNELPSAPVVAGGFGVGGFVPPVEDALHESAVQRGNERLAALNKRFAAGPARVTVYRVDQVAGAAHDSIPMLARTHDLFVMTLPSHTKSEPLISGVFADVIQGGSCGILGLPDAAKAPRSFEHVTIGWNGSREAARAVREAMPFFVRAREVVVLLVDQPLRRAGESHTPGRDLVAHLEHHGIKASLSRVTSEDLQTSEAILAEVTRLGSQILVIGAHAEGGLFRWFKHGVSRDVISAANIPLLMAH
jgi:nucleotide-binding universal stress UspA family protein